LIGGPSGQQSRGHPRQSGDETRIARFAILQRLAKAGHPGASDTWSLAMIGVTLALAICGGMVAASRRFLPRRADGVVQVVGRVSLSPKHAVYLLRVGRRLLLVGAGSQGAPSLISELDDLVEFDPDLPARGEEA
jgi:flagellar biogenesis protein FliO